MMQPGYAPLTTSLVERGYGTFLRLWLALKRKDLRLLFKKAMLYKVGLWKQIAF